MVNISAMKKYLLRSEPVFNRILAGSLIAMVAVLGMVVVVAGRAATQQLYMDPAIVSINQNTDFNVSVRINSGTDPVNAVEADLTYDSTKLQYVSVSSTGSDFPLEASTQATTGSLKLARATNPGSAPITGDGLVAIVTFHSLTGSGSSSITFAGSSAVVRSTDNTNVLIDSGSTTVNFSVPATPTPTPSATPTPTSTPAPTASPTPTPTPTPNPSGDSAHLYLSPANAPYNDNGSFSVQVREDSGTAAVNPPTAKLASHGEPHPADPMLRATSSSPRLTSRAKGLPVLPLCRAPQVRPWCAHRMLTIFLPRPTVGPTHFRERPQRPRLPPRPLTPQRLRPSCTRPLLHPQTRPRW
jgi:hypothetical protein